MFKDLNSSVEYLIDEIINLAYFMRGSIQYDDLMFKTKVERDRISKFIETNIELMRKSGGMLPLM